MGVNSGTDAIYLSLRALGVGPSDEVLTVANTATPTVSAIRMTGARPVFVDIDSRTQLMDVNCLTRAISPAAKAVVPVHLFGRPAEMNPILAVARRHRLRVVEDAAQAAGASYEGRKVGTLGDCGCFSFYPTKPLGGLGDGGAIVTDSDRLAQHLRRLRNYGEKSKYRNVIEGVNSRLDEIQAALLRWGLTKLDQWNARRSRIAGMYLDGLAGLPLRLPPQADSGHEPAWHLFVIRSRRRSALMKYLHAHGVQTAIHYPRPIYRQLAYRFLNYTDRDLPVTAGAMAEVLSLPIFPEMTDRQVQTVCGLVRSAVTIRGGRIV